MSVWTLCGATFRNCIYRSTSEQSTKVFVSFPSLISSWLYRIRPSACHVPFKKVDNKGLLTNDFSKCTPNPNQLRWKPYSIPEEPTDFVEGLKTIAGTGDTSMKSGLAIHIYTANTSMKDKSFFNSDGDFLIGKFLIS